MSILKIYLLEIYTQTVCVLTFYFYIYIYQFIFSSAHGMVRRDSELIESKRECWIKCWVKKVGRSGLSRHFRRVRLIYTIWGSGTREPGGPHWSQWAGMRSEDTRMTKRTICTTVFTLAVLPSIFKEISTSSLVYEITQ